MTTDPIRALVVDDEPAAREAIATFLSDHPDIVVVGAARNGSEALKQIRQHHPELLFLDIQLPDMDGFEVLESLGADVPAGVVFVTAHDAYALRAFEVHALDYVLKPFGKPRFDIALKRAIERLRALDALSLRSTINVIRRIAVRTGTKLMLVDVAQIKWIEASGDYVRIYTDEQSHLIDERISSLEQSLNPQQFCRIHRSCIVRLDSVRELHRESDGGGTIIIAGGVRLRVARNRWQAFAEALKLI